MNYHLLVDRFCYYFLRKPLYKVVEFVTPIRYYEPSGEEIDIIIPAIEKDLETLPLCIAALRKYITNKIRDIYIVSPLNEQIEKFCRDNNLIFIFEQDVLGFGVKDISYITSKGVNRTGWIFQQLLKLSGAIGTCENFVTIDSDHILLKPHTFLTSDNKFVIYKSEEFHLKYYITNSLLTGKLKIPLFSNVVHKMIFNKIKLCELKLLIEQKTGKQWVEAILDALDKNDASSFSEFELYGNFISSASVNEQLWRQVQLSRRKIYSYKDILNNYPNKLSMTFPEFLK